MREKNYAEDIRIDDQCLDIEWLEQPALMYKYAQMSAEAKQALDRTKDKLDLVKAELDNQIRKDPSLFGVEKLTETVVLNTILNQDEYQTAQESVLEAKYNFDLARGATDAVNARKDALENMVKLYGMQYFAGPKVPHDLANMRKRESEFNEQTAAVKIARTITKKRERE